MNYLAHAFLSGSDNDLLIGNFIADHLRGNNFEGLSPQIIKGIKLHRRIDEFTDAHPLFKKSKRVFYGHFEKYSGVLVDIYFDHLLAKNFDHFSKETLNDFTKRVYTVYHGQRHILPLSSGRFLDYVISNNIYTAYGKREGIEKVLFHLSHRIQHGVELHRSVETFTANEASLTKDFQLFFEEAITTFLPPE